MNHWFNEAVAAIQTEFLNAAESRQMSLTKPPGALGRLETLAVQFAGWQGQEKPRLDSVAIAIFAADHGVVAEGVSAFPQAVTVEMIKNFASGGAAISVLARQQEADLHVVSLGTAFPLPEIPGVLKREIAPGTANFVEQPAMTPAQCLEAMSVGREWVDTRMAKDAQLFIGGEMGIGNTTSATALICALLDVPPDVLAGAGTGLDDAGIAHKVSVIETALLKHPARDAFSVLTCLGGLEIAALTGAYIAAAQKGVPVLVDGFIATAAALLAQSLNAGVRDWMLFAHCSAEQGHGKVLQALAAQPILSLGMRLGEGSGAAVCLPVIRAALALHNEMATFAEASVSEKLSSE
ncbi:MAG: nicotinate-nucleotide--dimethylbenzimidazole phosphoribosyltransferase [Hahellaceae bacterium]|nr:nicotinate-nucleotide--dimethylbenzimidazole phosphoribosyltransferase [Hahellaceae bacterium]MCP5169135.1 nicotinate-nucleotide--dimethylbenzimidazole phosphoribosyltransferase [Hahellaceae bacterium]